MGTDHRGDNGQESAGMKKIAWFEQKATQKFILSYWKGPTITQKETSATL